MRYSDFLVLLALCAGQAVASEAAPAEWVRQLQKTSSHEFDVLAGPEEDRFYVKSVRVVSRAVLQEMVIDSGVPFLRPPEGLLTVTDANFDGHKDFFVPTSDGGAGPNSSYDFYLFDPQAGRYVRHAALSELSQVTIDSNGTISSGSRGGCCQHESATWRMRGNRLRKIASSERYWTPDNWIITTECKAVGAKMRCKTSKKRAPREPG